MSRFFSFIFFLYCFASYEICLADLPKILIIHSYEKGQICSQPQDEGLITGLAFHGYIEGVSVSIERFCGH